MKNKMNFLVVEDEPILRELIASFIETTLPDSTVFEVENGEEAIKFLQEKTTDIATIFCDYNMPKKNGGEVFQYLLENDLKIPFVLVSSSPPESLPEFLGHKVPLIEKPSIMDPLEQYLAKFSGPSEFQYQRVRIGRIRSVEKMEWNFYLKLSDEKFVKIIHKGSLFGDKELLHYESKNVNFLYIRSDEVKSVYSCLSEKLKQSLDKKQNVSMKTMILVNEVIQESVIAFGVTEEVQQLTKQAIEVSVEMIKKSPELSELVNSMEISEDSYISSHSAALSSLSCFITSKLSWSSEIAFKKLTLASILHDVSVENDQLAQIEEMSEFDNIDHSYTDTQIVDYKSHPMMAAEVINLLSSSDFPPDVSNIVLQHHERPDGSGFPNGIKSQQIAPLSAVFIISHEAVKAVAEKGKEFNVKNFLQEMKLKYSVGVFKKILKEVEGSLDSCKSV